MSLNPQSEADGSVASLTTRKSRAPCRTEAFTRVVAMGVKGQETDQVQGNVFQREREAARARCWEIEED